MAIRAATGEKSPAKRCRSARSGGKSSAAAGPPRLCRGTECFRVSLTINDPWAGQSHGEHGALPHPDEPRRGLACRHRRCRRRPSRSSASTSGAAATTRRTPSRSSTRSTYTVTLTVAGGDERLQRRLESASSLWTDRERPASGNGGLLSKARGDYRRLLAALYAAGYYGPEISIRAAGQEVADLTLAVEFPQNVPIAIRVVPGPRVPLRRHRDRQPPAARGGRERRRRRRDAGVGRLRHRRAGAIPGSSTRSRRSRSSAGGSSPAPRRARPSARSSPTTPTTGSTSRLTLDPGRAARYGPVRGGRAGRRVDPGVHRLHGRPRGRRQLRPRRDPGGAGPAEPARRLPLAALRGGRGDRARRQPADHRRASRTAGRAPSASAARSRPSTASASPPSGSTATSSAAPSSCASTPASTGWAGRSTPRTTTTTSASPSPSPGVFNPDTNFITSLIGQRVNFDTYRERSVTASAGFSRQFGARLTGDRPSSRRRAPATTTTSASGISPPSGVVGRAAYDARDDPLDATPRLLSRARGAALLRGRVRQPRRCAARWRAASTGRFGQEDSLVLAGRAKVGSFVGPDIAESPPDLLFFAGGGGSVRGYAYQSIGVETVDAGGGRHRHRRQGAVRGLGRGALPHQRELRRRSASSTRASSPRTRSLSRRAATCAPASGSACATIPASASCGPISPRRSTRATDDSLRRALHRHRAGVLRRLLAALGVLVLVAIAAVAQDAGPQRQRLPHQPAGEPALDARPARSG